MISPLNTLPLAVLGAKTSLDLITTSFNVTKSTTSFLAKMVIPKKHRDLKEYFNDSDINFKLLAVSAYINKNPDNICYDGMIEIITKISNVLTKIYLKQKLNKDMRIKYFNFNYDNEITDLESLTKLLDSRLDLMVKLV